MNDQTFNLRFSNELSEIKDLFTKLEKKFDIGFKYLSERINNNNNLHLENHHKSLQSFNDLKEYVDKNNSSPNDIRDNLRNFAFIIDKLKSDSFDLYSKIKSLEKILSDKECSINNQSQDHQRLVNDVFGLRNYLFLELENIRKKFEKSESALKSFTDTFLTISEWNTLANNSLNSAHLNINIIKQNIISFSYSIKEHKDQFSEDLSSTRKSLEKYVDDKIENIPKPRLETPPVVLKEINIIKLNIENLVHQKNVIESNLRRLLLANQV